MPCDTAGLGSSPSSGERTKVARIGNSSEGSTLYITASPCLECSKLIIQAGIKRVVYNDLYRIQDGLEILRRAGVECTHIAEID